MGPKELKYMFDYLISNCENPIEALGSLEVLKQAVHDIARDSQEFDDGEGFQ